MLNRLRYALAALLGRTDFDRELDEEIDSTLPSRRKRTSSTECRRARRVVRHWSRLAARSSSRKRIATREERGGSKGLVADLRFAARSLRRNGALTTTAVATLALVIGANTAIFSAVDAVLLRPLPFVDPDRLVMVGENNREFLWHMADAAPANFLDWRARVPAFRDAMAYADFPTPLR